MINKIRMKKNTITPALKNFRKNVTGQLQIVASKTAKKTRTFMVKDLQKTLGFNVTQKKLKQTITSRKSGWTKHTITLPKEFRQPLRDFKARHIKAGVSYKIDSRAGRQVAPGAFMGPKPGTIHTPWNGRAFKRLTKKRLPIAQLHGASPWGIFTKNKRTKLVVKEANKILRAELAERLRYLTLKNQGVI